MIFFVVRFVVEVVLEVVGNVFMDIVTASLSYEKRPLSIRSSSPVGEILKRLHESASGPDPSHVWSLPLNIRSVVPDGIHIETRSFLGPAFRGKIDTKENGCVVSGRLTLGDGARIASVLTVLTVMIGLPLGALLIFGSSAGCGIACVAATLLAIIVISVGLRISHHKGQIVAVFVTKLRGAISAEEPGE